MAAVQFAADLLLLEQLPVPDFYALPDWLADEVRHVLVIYHNNKPR